MAGQPYGADINTLLSFLAVEGKYYPPPLPELGTVHWLVGGAVADASNIACTADLRLVPDGYGSISQGVGSGGSGGSVAEKGELLATINVGYAAGCATHCSCHSFPRIIQSEQIFMMHRWRLPSPRLKGANCCRLPPRRWWSRK